MTVQYTPHSTGLETGTVKDHGQQRKSDRHAVRNRNRTAVGHIIANITVVSRNAGGAECAVANNHADEFRWRSLESVEHPCARSGIQ